jgi:hypothetical protein
MVPKDGKEEHEESEEHEEGPEPERNRQVRPSTLMCHR